MNRLTNKEDNEEQVELAKRLVNIYKFDTDVSSSNSNFKKVSSCKDNLSGKTSQTNNKQGNDQCKSSDVENEKLKDTCDKTQTDLNREHKNKFNGDSVSSAFDTCVFLLCFTVFFLILIWVSVKTAANDASH